MTDTQSHTNLAGLLEACPFCGGEAAFGAIRYTQSPYVDERCKDQLEYHQVNCVSCNATVKGLAGIPTQAEAAAAWNRRTLSALQADNERLREALEPFAELAEWYDDREDDSFPVWSDYPHGWRDKRLAELRHFRRARAALKESNHVQG
jgi:hypothetical protein